MKLPLYQIDAFSKSAFGGNPAAVVPLEEWLPDNVMLNIAKENNLSETAFFVPANPDEQDVDYHLRWFTPAVEVDLCGHATLAAAHVLFNHVEPCCSLIHFSSKSGPLSVRLQNDKIELDFPSRMPEPAQVDDAFKAAMGGNPIAILKGERDYLFHYGTAKEVADLEPDFTALKELGFQGYIATAEGGDEVPDTGEEGEEPNPFAKYDFISRCFFPAYNIDEDPVTGSAHCTSAPYWAEKLGKTELYAHQASERGGDLWLRVEGERVFIAGQSKEVIEGVLTL
jgi:PhzF family phenazine biosynthesis protein